MRKLNKSLVLIVWNEIEGCKEDVPLLPLDDFDEVFAVDGGSTDGTAEFLQSQGIPVYRQSKKSLNAAYADAVAISKCEAVVVFFPKATIDPIIVRELSRKIDLGFDLVVASRNLPGGHNEEDEKLFKPRKWGVSVLSSLDFHPLASRRLENPRCVARREGIHRGRLPPHGDFRHGRDHRP